MRYAVRLGRDSNGTILVTCPGLPEVTTFGEDRDDALLRAVDAIETAIQARIADRDDIPLPSRKGKTFATLPAQTAVKVLLWRAMRAQKIRKAELAKRLNWHAPQVDRLLDLSHASRLDQIEAALKAVGAELEVSLKEVA